MLLTKRFVQAIAIAVALSETLKYNDSITEIRRCCIELDAKRLLRIAQIYTNAQPHCILLGVKILGVTYLQSYTFLQYFRNIKLIKRKLIEI